MQRRVGNMLSKAANTPAPDGLADRRPRFTPSPETQREMLTSFLQAVQGGDMDGLMTMLADDVTLWADGGGKVRGAATRPLVGRDAVARFSVGTLRFLPEGYTLEIVEINGQPALVVRVGGRTFSVIAIEVELDQMHSDLHLSVLSQLSMLRGPRRPGARVSW
jgi:RNA polymerase sigma-70 factor (ECF subfamily)